MTKAIDVRGCTVREMYGGVNVINNTHGRITLNAVEDTLDRMKQRIRCVYTGLGTTVTFRST